MNAEEVRKRVAELLLSELMSEEPRQWWYVSTAAEKFVGGYFLKAHGPTDAWKLLHALGWWERGCETLTNGPIPNENMEKVPESMRWRRLTKEEAESLWEGERP